MNNYHNHSGVQLIDAVLARYDGAETLSQNKRICRYSPIYNGIGCAIGCLLPIAVAERWDTVGNIHAVAEGGEKASFQRFFKNSQLSVLRELQHMHDWSDTVEGFRTAMGRYREKLEEEAAHGTK